MGLYLYYTTCEFYREKSLESEVAPITNLVFSYGDISPRYATTEDLAAAFKRSYDSTSVFDASNYSNPIWECVMGVTGSPANWKLTGEGAERYSFNKGAVPGMNGNGWEGSDNRVYAYVDRALNGRKYAVRNNCKLPEFGYYSPESTFGIAKQAG